MAAPRQSPTATALPSGQVLVTGGSTALAYTAAAEFNSPASRAGPQWARPAPATAPPSSSYSPTTGTRAPAFGLHRARSGHTAPLLSDEGVPVTGGTSQRALAPAELFAPTTGRWREVGGMEAARSHHTAPALREVLLTSGYGHALQPSAEFFTPAAPVQEPLADAESFALLPGPGPLLSRCGQPSSAVRYRPSFVTYAGCRPPRSEPSSSRMMWPSRGS